MLRCATGEEWNGLMHDAMVAPESGLCDAAKGDCGSPLAVPFFVSYVLLTTFIVLKMLVALILEGFFTALQRDRDSLDLEHADVFVDRWSSFDPDATGWMHARFLIKLLRQLPPPLGLDPHDYPHNHIRAQDYTLYAFRMHLHPRYNESGVVEVSFSQVLACLCKDAILVEDTDAGAGGGGDGDATSGADGQQRDTVAVAWRAAQRRAQRREMRMQGGNAWSAVLLRNNGAKAAKVIEVLRDNNVRTTAPDEGVLATSIATSVIANAWRERALRPRDFQRRIFEAVRQKTRGRPVHDDPSAAAAVTSLVRVPSSFAALAAVAGAKRLFLKSRTRLV